MRIQNIILASLAVISLSAIGVNAQAIESSTFKAGRIIDDSIFTNKDALSAAQIQTFLEQKVPACDTNGEQLSEYGGTDINGDGKVQRWEYGQPRGFAAPYICLKDYQENGVSAAEIIHTTAQRYNINPQVLIVILQKEQGLVTDTWPIDYQYKYATGMGCPDTASCGTQYYGFTNQLKASALMFNSIMTDSPTWYTSYALGNNYIKFSPNAGCGGNTVFIENRATLALYNYTPYQPNQASLNAGYGTGDACSTYGNRNFWRYFTEWFGSTLAIDTPAPIATLTINTKENDTVVYDSDVTIHWESQSADTCSINGEIKTATTGELAIPKVTSSSSFSLLCVGKGGEIIDTVQLTVLPPTYEYLLAQIDSTPLVAAKSATLNSLTQEVKSAQRTEERGDTTKAIKTLEATLLSIDKLVAQKKLTESDGNFLSKIVIDLITSKS